MEFLGLVSWGSRTGGDVPAFADGGQVGSGINVERGAYIVKARSARKHAGLLARLGGGSISQIRGPGTGRSDSILARGPGGNGVKLSNMEAYVPPDVYRQDPELFQAINEDKLSQLRDSMRAKIAGFTNSSLNVPGFADGGQITDLVNQRIGNVNPVARRGPGGGMDQRALVSAFKQAIKESPPQVNLKSVNVSSPGDAFEQGINTRQGEQAFMNMINRNRRNIKGSLG